MNTEYVLISYGPAPYCGNPGMISFLDRCLFRLYKPASRDLWAYQKLMVFQEVSGIAEFSETITTLSSLRRIFPGSHRVILT